MRYFDLDECFTKLDMSSRICRLIYEYNFINYIRCYFTKNVLQIDDVSLLSKINKQRIWNIYYAAMQKIIVYCLLWFFSGCVQRLMVFHISYCWCENGLRDEDKNMNFQMLFVNSTFFSLFHYTNNFFEKTCFSQCYVTARRNKTTFDFHCLEM